MPGPLLSQKSQVVVVVDPYSSGRFLVASLLRRGFTLVCVQTTLNVAPYFLKSFDPAQYLEVIVFDGDASSLTSRLRSKYNVLSVIAGSEPGVELADILCADLCPQYSNGLELSKARRNKYLMNERVRACGLRAVQQFSGTNKEDVLAWVRNWGHYPVVLKPACSMGTDGVYLCHNEEEVIAACDAVLGHTNPAGTVNECVLAQEYLCGTEYIVDTVSKDGKTQVVGIWKYTKGKMNGGNFVYFRVDLLPSEGAVQKQLTDYVTQVVAALNIRYGPGHAEIMMVRGEPVLVEIGARLQGGGGPAFVQECTDSNQVELTVDVLVNGDMFDQLYGRPYKLFKNVLEVFLISHREGTLANSVADHPVLNSLPSLQYKAISAVAGDRVVPTYDLMSSPGYVILAHESAQQIDEDFAKIRELERTSLYELVEDRPIKKASFDNTSRLSLSVSC